MAMQLARAFIDLHHLAEETVYQDNDFPLVVDDGTGSPKIHPDLTGNGMQSGNAWSNVNIQDLGILMGWATRSLNFAGGVDNQIGNRSLERVSYLIMGRDPDNNNIIDPTWYMRSPSQGDQLVFDFDVNGMIRDLSQIALFGGMFCDQNGVPNAVSLGGNSDVIALGLSYTDRGGALGSNRFGLFRATETSYPNSPDDTKSQNFLRYDGLENPGNQLLFQTSGQRRRAILDSDSASFADILEDGTLTGPFKMSESDVDTLFDRNSDNINLLPTLYSRNVGTEPVGLNDGFVDFDWDIFYRNRSDA